MRLPARSSRGFSLIEVLVALAIIAALSAVLIPSVSSWKSLGALDAAERELTHRVAQARLRAARSGASVPVDAQGLTEAPTKPVTGVSAAPAPAAPVLASTEESGDVVTEIAATALPDGRLIAGSTITLRAGGRERTVRVNPWTGLVERVTNATLSDDAGASSLSTETP